MDIQTKQPTTTGDPQFFAGEVFIDRIATDPGRVRANLVRFTPGARNAWHRHIHGQTLHVVDGIGLVQSRGEAVTVIRAGDTVWTPPDEWHWHGAAPITSWRISRFGRVRLRESWDRRPNGEAVSLTMSTGTPEPRRR